MPEKIKSSKRKRKPKSSKGIHGGGGKVRLTRLQLALMGKGPTARAAVVMFKESDKRDG